MNNDDNLKNNAIITITDSDESDNRVNHDIIEIESSIDGYSQHEHPIQQQKPNDNR